MNGRHPFHIITAAYDVLGNEEYRLHYDADVPLEELAKMQQNDWKLQQKQEEHEEQRVIILMQGIPNESVHCYIIVALQVIMGMDEFMHKVNRAHEDAITTTTSKFNIIIPFFY